MKITILISLMLISFLAITACQQNRSEEDSVKVQESIEKLKTKIQENLANDKKLSHEGKESTLPN